MGRLLQRSDIHRVPVTHFFYNKNINLDYTYGNSEGIGNVALMPCFEEELKKAGVTLMYRTSAVQFLQDANKRVTGLIAGRPNNYTQINAAKASLLQPAATAPMKK